MEKRLTVAGAASPDAPRLSVSTWLALFGAYWVDGGAIASGIPRGSRAAWQALLCTTCVR
jgi:hypothetical protein